jgi:hypothetical protein
MSYTAQDWFDFVDRWGNTASVVGLFLTLVVGFPVTWRIQSKIRRASQEAMRKVALMVLSQSVEDLQRQLHTALDAGRLGNWSRSYDCCSDARIGFLRLVGNPHLILDEKEALRGGAGDLTQIMQYIDNNKLKTAASPSFQKEKKESIDALVIQLTNIQMRLGQKTWEV